MTTSIKTCFKCGEVKPLDDFYKHRRMGDGHLNKCKECTKKDANERRADNLETIREYDRNRGNRQGYAYTKAYRAENPKKYKAHSAVNNAVKLGKIEKTPCFVCGVEITEAHHVDYDSPLDVVWLCPCCHKQTHAAHKRYSAST